MPSKEKPKASQKGQRPLKTLCKSSNNGPKGTMYSSKKNKDTFFNPTLKQKNLWNFLILHLKAKYKAYSYFVILTIQNDYKFTSGKIKRVQSRADNYNAYHKLAVAVAEVKGSSIAITLVLLQQHIAI